MLVITRTQPTGSAMTTFLDASISLRDGVENVDGFPDVTFSMDTYQKIAKLNEDQAGDQILLPINLFFETLTFNEQKNIYKMYRAAKLAIISLMPDRFGGRESITSEKLMEVQRNLQNLIFKTVNGLGLPDKMIQFCKTDIFVYPDLKDVGTQPHHTAEKTYLDQDYVEITAISLLSKLMVPIWGEFIKVMSILEINFHHRERLAFGLIEQSLEEGGFERIYKKLSQTLVKLVKDCRAITDKKAVSNGVTSSFIITHSGVDDWIFDDIVMAAIIVKRMATYECFKRKDGSIPNAIVYIDDGIKRQADSRIQQMRKEMPTMPHWDLPTHETEDNSSILDHTSRASNKPIDAAILVITAAEKWVIPKLRQELQIPNDVFDAATDYYLTNSFDVTPICQAMVACCFSNRFGGSKCLSYLTPKLYQQLVTMLQIFLIRHDLYDLAALISSKTSLTPIEGASGSANIKLQSIYDTSDEYLQCKGIIKGYLEKPVQVLGKKTSAKKEIVERLDFVNHISRMVDWLIHYVHSENMAPAIWDLTKVDNRPITGSPVRFDENVIRNLCKFYLMFIGGQRAF